MVKKPKILIVDDEKLNRDFLKNYLSTLGYTPLEAENGKKGLGIIMKEYPDVIILDLNMPEMDGFELLKIIKINPETRMIPVIVITALGDENNHLKALELGADDFLTKPFNIHFLKARLRSLVTIKMLYDINVEYQNKLKESNIELMRELIKTQEVTIIALAKLAEFRDPETGEHLERIREYVRILAEELKKHKKYEKYIDNRYLEHIFKSSLLHDIGKVGIPDYILFKPAKLTEDEFNIMKKHTIIGGNAIESAIKHVQLEKSFLDMAKNVAYFHHERWDGNGYPYGLKGEDIPLSARITAVADVYDALTTRRVYKPPFPHEKAKNIILSEMDGHFDPEIVDAFIKREDEFLEFKEKLKDSDTNYK